MLLLSPPQDLQCLRDRPTTGQEMIRQMNESYLAGMPAAQLAALGISGGSGLPCGPEG